jgi:hypothetical protein
MTLSTKSCVSLNCEVLCRQTPFYGWPGDRYTLLDNEEGFQGLQYSKRRQYIPHSVLVEIFLGRRISFSPSSMYPVVDIFPVVEFFLDKESLVIKDVSKCLS